MADNPYSIILASQDEDGCYLGYCDGWPKRPALFNLEICPDELSDDCEIFAKHVASGEAGWVKHKPFRGTSYAMFITDILTYLENHGIKPDAIMVRTRGGIHVLNESTDLKDVSKFTLVESP